MCHVSPRKALKRPGTEPSILLCPTVSINCPEIKKSEALEYKAFVFWRDFKKYLSTDNVFRYKVNSLPKEKKIKHIENLQKWELNDVVSMLSAKTNDWRPCVHEIGDYLYKMFFCIAFFQHWRWKVNWSYSGISLEYLPQNIWIITQSVRQKQ